MIDGEDEGGAGGADAGTEGAGGAGTGGAGGGAGGEGAGAAAPWYGELSADAADDKSLSDRAWMENKKYADPAALVKAHRALEGKLASDKRVEIPGEGATDEQRAAFHKAIGVPEKPDGYTFDVPDDWKDDVGVLTSLRETAHKAGMPLSAWSAFTGAALAKVMDDHNAMVDGQNAERVAVEKEWGAQKDQNLALVKRGFEAFGLKPAQVQAMQTALGEGGTKMWLDLGLKLGRLSGEDGFIPGGKKDFGIAPADARNQLKAFEKDPAKIALLKSKDPATVAAHDRLITIIAADDDRRERADASA